MSKKTIELCLCLAAVMLLGLFIGSPRTIPLAVWLQVIVLVRFLRGQPVWRGALLAWVANSAVGYVAAKGVVPLSDPIYLGFSVMVGAMSLIPYLADRLLAPRVGGLAGTLVLPTAAVAWAFLDSWTSPYGSWGLIGYLHPDNLALMQLVSVVGMWGPLFLISWTGSLVNEVWESAEAGAWPRVRTGASLYGTVLLLVFFIGEARLALTVPTTETVRVAAIAAPSTERLRAAVNQGELGRRFMSGDDLNAAERETIRAAFAPLTEELFTLTRREAQNGAKLVFWPEAATWALEEDEAALIAQGQQVAREEGIYLGMGIATFRAGALGDNKAILIEPDGRVAWHYLKSHLVVGAEDSILARGDGRMPVLDTPYGRLGVAICHDMDHHQFVQQAGAQEVDLLWIPTGDWKDIERLHLGMTVTRAIEQGVTVIRPTRGGISAAIDPQGRLLSTLHRSDAHFDGTLVTPPLPAEGETLVAQVPTQGMPTLYRVVQDGFAWGCLLVLAALSARGLLRRRTVVMAPQPT